LAQGRSLTVAALLVGSTVCSQQSRDRQGALRDPNLQILLQRLILASPGPFAVAGRSMNKKLTVRGNEAVLGRPPENIEKLL
jgi:hypothetical protein